MPDMAGGPRRLLQQFARLPVPGRVKTRLLGELSMQEACAVHEELLLRTAVVLCASGLGPVELWLDRGGASPTIEAALEEGAGGPLIQAGGDLGARMHHALSHGLERADAVVLVGSDCPGITADYLGAAFTALNDHDVALGPADDGGFVLIGCRRLVRGALDRVPWGTSEVLDATLAQLSRVGLSTTLLPSRYDIDTPRDLRRWREESSGVCGD